MQNLNPLEKLQKVIITKLNTETIIQCFSYKLFNHVRVEIEISIVFSVSDSHTELWDKSLLVNETLYKF